MSHAATAKTIFARFDLYSWLGAVIGIVMPVLSALLYPTYMHQMQPEWAEWTRLLELPFVVCELAIIHVAGGVGYRNSDIWRSLPRDVMAAIILLLIGLTFSSVFFSKNLACSITLSITTLVHLRFCAAIFFLARATPMNGLRRFFPLLSLGLAALTIMTVFKFKLPPPEWTVPGGKIEWSSALPGFISVRHLGSWAGAIATGLMIALLYKKPWSPDHTAFLYLLAAGLTFWSGTRAAVLAMAVVALITAVGLRRLPDLRSIIGVAGLSAIAMLGAIVFSPGLPDFMLFVKGDAQNADALTSGRLQFWHDALLRWLDAPLFGWGSGSTFWELGWLETQPHNAIVQFLISWGIVGATGALWLLGRAIGATHRVGMDDELLRPLLATVYSLLVMSLLEGMLYYPRFIMLVMLGFAILLAAREQHAGQVDRPAC